jgi:hypothetical protein
LLCLQSSHAGSLPRDQGLSQGNAKLPLASKEWFIK